MCSVHCTKAVLRNIHRNYQKEIAESLKETYENEQKLQDIVDHLNALGYRKTANIIERFRPGIMIYTVFPQRAWEGNPNHQHDGVVNEELIQRTKVVGALSNEESLRRLVGSILMNVNGEVDHGQKVFGDGKGISNSIWTRGFVGLTKFWRSGWL